MHKIPRDISGKQLCNLLIKIGYEIIRQSGSHIRLNNKMIHHSITIPNHKSIKIGTLNNIINDIAIIHKATKNDIINKLF